MTALMLVAGIVVYLAFLVWLGCLLRRKAADQTRIHERLREMCEGTDDAGNLFIHQGGCPACARGEAPVLLDVHGTLFEVSGLPGRPGHAIDDFWWYCDQYQGLWT